MGYFIGLAGASSTMHACYEYYLGKVSTRILFRDEIGALGYLHPGPLKVQKPLSNSTISSNR